MKYFCQFGLIRLTIKPSLTGLPKNLHTRGGSTLTTHFTGLYASATQSEIVRDTVNVLFCDFDLDCGNQNHQAELTLYLEGLRNLLLELLNEEEVWIVYHPVIRIVG